MKIRLHRILLFSGPIFFIKVTGDHVPNIDSKFAQNAFNHMIVYVPLLQDSVWLECTNPFYPAGYLGDFTHDRYALLIEGNKSRLVRTPKFES